MNGIIKKITLFSIVYILPLSAYAGMIGSQSERIIHPVFSGAIGAVSANNLGAPRGFPIVNPNTDQAFAYSPLNQNQTKSIFELFVGLEREIIADWRVQMGLSYGQTEIFQVRGNLIQGVDSQSSNLYQYDFNVRAHELLAQMKLMRVSRDIFYPYLLVGLGTSFNDASDFGTSVPPTLAFTRNYMDETTRSFAYQFGAGLDVSLIQNVRLGVSYRYANLGAVRLGAANISGTGVSGTLSQSSLYANEVLLQLSCLI